MSAMFAPLAGMFAPVAGKAAMGGALAAGAGGLFAGGGTGFLGTVLGGLAQGLQARADARQREREAEAEMQRRRDNYAGAAEGVEAGWWRDPYDGEDASQAAIGFQRVDPNSNATLPVGQREQTQHVGDQYKGLGVADSGGGGGSLPAQPAAVGSAAPRYHYDRRSGRIQYG